jgi:hypothetical protein
MTEKKVLCVCGAPIRVMDADTEDPWWTHDAVAPACLMAIPAAGMPTGFDRKTLAERLRDQRDSFDRAADEIADLKRAVQKVVNHVAVLNTEAERFQHNERATLNRVWDRLTEVGDVVGASIVMRMIRGEES